MPSEKPYSKREMDNFFKSMTEKNDLWSSTILQKIQETHRERTEAIEDMRKHEIVPILEQTTRTNGRVSKLESRADRHERRWTWLTGAAFVLVPIFVTVCAWVVTRQISVETTIRSAVDEKFQNYGVTGTIEITK